LFTWNWRKRGGPFSIQGIIQQINASPSTQIISIDVPSGVPANGGEVKQAVKADLTITIHLPKYGAFTYPSASYYGEIVVCDIGIPPIAVSRCAAKRMIWTGSLVKQHLPKRSPSSHKGSNGKGLIIGGSRQMTGAVMLGAKAALRSGAGLLTVAIPDEIHPIAASHFLEAMYQPCPSEAGHFKGTIPVELETFDAVAVGPGIGRTNGGKRVVEEAIEQDIPLVIDADALYHLKDMLPKVKSRKFPTIITPHPGEMARVFDLSIKELEQDRFGLTKQAAEEYGMFVVLKGPYTSVTTPEGEQIRKPNWKLISGKRRYRGYVNGYDFGFFDAACTRSTCNQQCRVCPWKISRFACGTSSYLF
jgi:NAD(P)H-hydrate epimerase